MPRTAGCSSRWSISATWSTTGQPAARIHFHHTPWREPEVLSFKRDGLVLCKRIPARCERGDCLFHLATDLKE